MDSFRLLLLFCLFASAKASAQEFRYTEFIAPSATITSNVVYGQAPFLNFPYSDENFTSSGDLVMDVYAPTGDLHTRRAAIVFAHAGGFITGDRNHDDMVALCDSFARKGYVTATIDYRQGFYLFNNVPLHGTRAVYRGVQDGRSAVRYLRANAATYGIDPDQVYLAGSSAGSFIALQSIYLSSPDEIPAETGIQTYTDLIFPQTTPDLGPPDSGDNLNFSGTPNGVVALWGAVASPDWVDASDDQPVFLAHGTDDSTVPFTIGPPFGAGSFPDVFGSSVIADELAANGTTDYETYFIDGAEHEFYGTNNGTWANGSGPNDRWDSLLNRITPFLWQQHRPIADFSVTTDGLSAFFTDQSSGAVAWAWSFGDGATATGPNPQHTYTEAGVFPVRLFVQNEILSWDTLRMEVSVDATLPLSWIGRPLARREGKDIRISWEVQHVTNLSHFVVEHAAGGPEFFTLGELRTDQPGLTSLSYLHLAPASAQHSYRIRAVDLDGTESLSPIVSLSLEEGIRVYPNPTNGVLRLEGFTVPEIATVTDAQGRRVTTSISAAGTIDLRGWPAGVYAVQVGTETHRIVLQ